MIKRQFSDTVINISNHYVYFGSNLTFQIIPCNCLLTNLNFCLIHVSDEQYLMKIDFFITKDGNYKTHYRFFPLITQKHKKYQ